MREHARRLAKCWQAMILARSCGEWEIAAEERERMGEIITEIRETWPQETARRIIEIAASLAL